MTLQRILVAGGAGFIGSHTCKVLASSGYTPVVFDNLSTGHRENVRWGPLVEGDIRDKRAFLAALKEYQPAAVIHFAAAAYVGDSVVDPAHYYDNNVVGTHTLLEACRSLSINKVVFSSSCATYGIPDHCPISEETPQRPINPYGRTKLIGEQMLADYDRAFGLRHVALRYFNAAGADPEGELCERHDPETHLIPRIIMAAAGILDHVDIYGRDYETSDGTCIRDYIHVTDLAHAHLLALQYLARGGVSVRLNVGTGRGHSILEIIREVENLTGKPLPTRSMKRRSGDPPELFADPHLAEQVLGFAPKLSDLPNIIRTAAHSFGVVHASDQGVQTRLAGHV